VGCWKLGHKKARFSINAQVVILASSKRQNKNRGFLKMSRVQISKRGLGAWGIFFKDGGGRFILIYRKVVLSAFINIFCIASNGKPGFTI